MLPIENQRPDMRSDFSYCNFFYSHSQQMEPCVRRDKPKFSENCWIFRVSQDRIFEKY